MGQAITGAEIFAAGTWNERTFTEADLDGIVAAFNALNLTGRVPLKFGHNSEQPITDGQPALGWVSRVYRDGSKLLADFTDMPVSVYNAIKQGMYKFVSVELLRDVRASTRVIPWVLDAVALLGADQPAVGNLGDLQALTMRRATGFQYAARVEFRRDTPTSEDTKMSEQALNELRAQFTSLSTLVESVKADNAKLSEALRDRDEKLRKQSVEAHRNALKALFESAVKSTSILPAVREQFERIYNLSDDDAVMRVTAEQAQAFIDAHPNKDRKAAFTSANGTSDQPYEGDDPDAELVVRANALLKERNEKASDPVAFTRAMQDALRADKSLGERYKFMPDDKGFKKPERK